MTFRDTLAEVINWLQQDERLSYRALKRQFDLDDDYLEDLKLELIKVKQIAVDQDQKMLVWTGDLPERELDTQHETDRETRFHALLRVILALLQRERRVTYRELKYILDIDDDLLSEICQNVFEFAVRYASSQAMCYDTANSFWMLERSRAGEIWR